MNFIDTQDLWKEIYLATVKNVITKIENSDLYLTDTFSSAIVNIAQKTADKSLQEFKALEAKLMKEYKVVNLEDFDESKL